MTTKAMTKHTRAADGTIINRTCFVPIVGALGMAGAPCGDRVHKAGRCLAHWTDWRQSRESRRGTQRANPDRRLKRIIMRATGHSGKRVRRNQRRAQRIVRSGM